MEGWELLEEKGSARLRRETQRVPQEMETERRDEEYAEMGAYRRWI